MSAVSDALAEVNAALAAMAPAHEGLRDYTRLNLMQPALAEVNEALVAYDQRASALHNAQHALEQLLESGYPDLPVEAIPADAYADLAENQSTVAAALAIFSSAPPSAASLRFTVGEPEPKGPSGGHP